MQMVDKFQDIPIHGPRDADIVDEAEVDDVLAKSDTSCVWADWDAKPENYFSDSQKKGQT